MKAALCYVALSFWAAPELAGEDAEAKARLPEGRAGIAVRYPGDRGIEKDPATIFTEQFDETSLEPILKRWDNATGEKTMSLSPDTPDSRQGALSLLVTHTGGQGTGGHLYRRLLPGHRRVFARFYVKFDPDCAPVHHFGTHLGGYHPPLAWPYPRAGQKPDGTWFTTGVEPYGRDWGWDFYTYWQGMHTHGDGKHWGTTFLPGGPKPAVERGKWICVELMVQMNDPVEASNGEQAFWIDGKLWRRDGQVASHLGPGFPRGTWTGGWWSPGKGSPSTFEGFRWKSVEDLAVNYLWTYVYITRAPPGHQSRVWFDHIVVAREYIGPLEPSSTPGKKD